MTGAEIAAVGKAAKAVGEKVLAEDEKTKDVLLRRAEGTAEMAAAARTMAARTAVVERIKLKILQPLGFLFGVGSEYFRDTLPQEMAAKLADVPEESIIAPSPSVAGPTVLALSYIHSEPDLKDLYLNLLATASDSRRAAQAHPAFAEVIKQLAPHEAVLLKKILAKDRVEIVRVVDRLTVPVGSFIIRITHMLNLVNEKGEIGLNPQAQTWVDNWIRLGLVEVTYSEFTIDDNSYSWVENRPEYITEAAKSDTTNIGYDKGLLRVTNFGRQFLRAIT